MHYAEVFVFHGLLGVGFDVLFSLPVDEKVLCSIYLARLWNCKARLRRVIYILGIAGLFGVVNKGFLHV